MEEKKLLKAGSQSVNYLIRSIREDGSFIYQEKAISGKISSKYNMLRHAGTLFEICLWLELFPDVNELAAIEMPFNFLSDHLKEWDGHLCIAEQGIVKLGGSALALLALSAYYKQTGKAALLPIMEKLAGFLLFCQKPDGEFVSKYYLQGQKLSNFSSAYYPGQAILALANLYEVQRKPEWLIAAKKGATFLAEKPILTGAQRMNSRVFETWLSKALIQLLKLNREEIYAVKLQDIIDLNLAILNRSKQQVAPGEIKIKPFTSATMASLCEALVSGIRFCLLNKDFQEAKKLNRAVIEGLTFCLSLQIKKGQSKYSSATIGGIRKTTNNSTVRIDFVQHVLSVITAMIALETELTQTNYGFQLPDTYST